MDPAAIAAAAQAANQAASMHHVLRLNFAKDILCAMIRSGYEFNPADYREDQALFGLMADRAVMCSDMLLRRLLDPNWHPDRERERQP